MREHKMSVQLEPATSNNSSNIAPNHTSSIFVAVYSEASLHVAAKGARFTNAELERWSRFGPDARLCMSLL